MLIPSKQHEAWETEYLWELKKYKKCYERCEIEAIFYPPNLRRFDMSNSFESIADLFVKAGILKDDSVFLLQKVILQLGQVDKENPRVEIQINARD